MSQTIYGTCLFFRTNYFARPLLPPSFALLLSILLSWPLIGAPRRPRLSCSHFASKPPHSEDDSIALDPRRCSEQLPSHQGPERPHDKLAGFRDCGLSPVALITTTPSGEILMGRSGMRRLKPRIRNGSTSRPPQEAPGPSSAFAEGPLSSAGDSPSSDMRRQLGGLDLSEGGSVANAPGARLEAPLDAYPAAAGRFSTAAAAGGADSRALDSGSSPGTEVRRRLLGLGLSSPAAAGGDSPLSTALSSRPPPTPPSPGGDCGRSSALAPSSPWSSSGTAAQAARDFGTPPPPSPPPPPPPKGGRTDRPRASPGSEEDCTDRAGSSSALVEAWGSWAERPGPAAAAGGRGDCASATAAAGESPRGLRSRLPDISGALSHPQRNGGNGRSERVG